MARIVDTNIFMNNIMDTWSYAKSDQISCLLTSYSNVIMTYLRSGVNLNIVTGPNSNYIFFLFWRYSILVFTMFLELGSIQIDAERLTRNDFTHQTTQNWRHILSTDIISFKSSSNSRMLIDLSFAFNCPGPHTKSFCENLVSVGFTVWIFFESKCFNQEKCSKR